jgi:plastocyanin
MGMISREITAGIAAQFPDRFPGELAAPPAELRSRLTLLLSEHIYLAASATRAVLKGRQLEFEAAAGMIDLNSNDLAAAIGSTFGQEAQDAFLPMWRKHVGLADEYTISLASNVTSGQRTALEKLLAYPAELGAFLNTLNPDIPEDALAGLEEDHIRSLIEIIDSQNVGNEAAASNLLRQAYAHTGMMAALLAEGILPPSASANDQAGMVMQVEISVFAFVPAEIEVKVGTTVIWTNQDETVHTITSGTIDNAGGDFDSAPFTKGQSFAFLFTKPGDYPYFCRVHPEMVGLVRVVP